MATRSFIHVQLSDGNWGRIYCHWDGYLDGVGATLQEFYNSQEKAEALIALGNISSLGEEIGEKHDFDYVYKLQGNDPEYARLAKMCNAYGRDRGEKDVAAVIGGSLEEVFASEEYMYVWRDSAWHVMSYTDDLSKLRPLSEALGKTDDPDEEEDEMLDTAKTEDAGGDDSTVRAA